METRIPSVTNTISDSMSCFTQLAALGGNLVLSPADEPMSASIHFLGIAIGVAASGGILLITVLVLVIFILHNTQRTRRVRISDGECSARVYVGAHPG